MIGKFLKDNNVGNFIENHHSFGDLIDIAAYLKPNTKFVSNFRSGMIVILEEPLIYFEDRSCIKHSLYCNLLRRNQTLPHLLKAQVLTPIGVCIYVCRLVSDEHVQLVDKNDDFIHVELK
jgi:hypothetical protein